MKSILAFAFLSFVGLKVSAFAQELTSKALEIEAERLAQDVILPNRLERLSETLTKLKSLSPNSPYPFWAQARLAFLRTQEMRLDRQLGADQRSKRLVSLAEACHISADACVALDSKNPECHMAKGTCYAIQAMAWGSSLKTLRTCKSMDKELEKAETLPSSFQHRSATSTRQYARVMRAILYRVMPDSFWFGLLAGIRGNIKQSYTWMKASVTGALLNDPLFVSELASISICYGRESKNEEIVRSGMTLIQNGIRLPTRYPIDIQEKMNMMVMYRHPEKACIYRKENFEKISQEATKP